MPLGPFGPGGGEQTNNPQQKHKATNQLKGKTMKKILTTTAIAAAAWTSAHAANMNLPF